jgi:hypothetical protein
MPEESTSKGDLNSGSRLAILWFTERIPIYKISNKLNITSPIRKIKYIPINNTGHNTPHIEPLTN